MALVQDVKGRMGQAQNREQKDDSKPSIDPLQQPFNFPPQNSQII